MAFELHDNARSALHYLLLGVLVVGAALLANMVLNATSEPIGPEGSFAHGYLIDDDGHDLVRANTTRGERMATAVALGTAAAIALGLLVAVIARVLGARVERPAVIAARSAFLITFAYGAHAALFRPPHEFIGTRDHMLILWHRDILLNDIPWPIEKHIELVAFSDVTSVEAHVVSGTLKDRIEVTCRMRAGGELMLGNSVALDPGDTSALHFAHQRAAGIEALWQRD